MSKSVQIWSGQVRGRVGTFALIMVEDHEREVAALREEVKAVTLDRNELLEHYQMTSAERYELKQQLATMYTLEQIEKASRIVVHASWAGEEDFWKQFKLALDRLTNKPSKQEIVMAVMRANYVYMSSHYERKNFANEIIAALEKEQNK